MLYYFIGIVLRVLPGHLDFLEHIRIVNRQLLGQVLGVWLPSTVFFEVIESKMGRDTKNPRFKGGQAPATGNFIETFSHILCCQK